MICPWRRATGLAFVFAVLLNLNVLGACPEKDMRAERGSRMAEKQFPPVNALSCATGRSL